MVIDAYIHLVIFSRKASDPASKPAPSRRSPPSARPSAARRPARRPPPPDTSGTPSRRADAGSLRPFSPTAKYRFTRGSVGPPGPSALLDRARGRSVPAPPSGPLAQVRRCPSDGVRPPRPGAPLVEGKVRGFAPLGLRATERSANASSNGGCRAVTGTRRPVPPVSREWPRPRVRVSTRERSDGERTVPAVAGPGGAARGRSSGRFVSSVERTGEEEDRRAWPALHSRTGLVPASGATGSGTRSSRAHPR